VAGTGGSRADHGRGQDEEAVHGTLGGRTLTCRRPAVSVRRGCANVRLAKRDGRWRGRATGGGRCGTLVSRGARS
jgi:hypothetical protein